MSRQHATSGRLWSPNVYEPQAQERESLSRQNFTLSFSANHNTTTIIPFDETAPTTGSTVGVRLRDGAP
jgi:hypothetical protein